MAVELRVVFDTNTLVSAACFPQSFGYKAFAHIAINGVAVACKESIAEFSDVLFRPKFDRFAASPVRKRFFDNYCDFAELFDIPNMLRVSRDPTDDKFLELAMVGQAQFIVTRDKDMLVLDPFQGVQILDAERFVALFSYPSATTP